jgi:hypothetical protein
VEVVRVAGAEGADGAGGVDEDVRRHSADAEELGVLAGFVEEDGGLDAPELGEVLRSLSRVASLPDVDENYVQTRPVCFTAAELF